MTAERLATAQVDSVLSADGRRPARLASNLWRAGDADKLDDRAGCARGSSYLSITRSRPAASGKSVTMTRSPGAKPLTISSCDPDIRP